MKTDRCNIIAMEMKRYKLSILGLSETRWTLSGEMKLVDGTTIFYSGHQEDGAPHTVSIAFMLTSEARKAMISWEPINKVLSLPGLELDARR